jgi:hypothetical protein
MSNDSPAEILFDTSGNEKGVSANPVVVGGNKTNNNAAPGATNVGALPAVANAAAPSLTEGNQVALSTTLTGALREDVTSWMGSTTPTVGQKAMAASLPVTTASDQTPPVNSTTTGTISALNGVVSAAVQGWNSCMVVITGTWTATLVFEVSSDGGTTWFNGAFASPPAVLSPMPVPLLSVAANGTYQGVGLGAITNVRVRASAYSAGPVSVRLVFSGATAGLLPGFTAIQQNVTVSLYNNSTANLAAGASFTGTTESTLGVAGIQVNFKADQPFTLQVQQSIDGTNWDIVDSFQLPASVGWATTVQATASYFRLVVTNIGGATTTYLRLQTALCPTVEAVPRALGPSGGLKVEAGVGSGSWIPATPATFFGLTRGTRAPLTLGLDGSLQCYSEVLTDAGSFREDYLGTSLQSNLTGTMYFVNGSTTVTGVGCAFTTQISRFSFIKLTGHADTALTNVVNVIDDNNLTLAAAYTGATGSGVGINSFWFPTVGSGGSLSVATSQLSIASGTTNGANTWVQRGSDYGPMQKTLRISISQRITNQTIRLGFFDNFASPTQQACVEFTGTDNTQITLVCRSSAAAADLESVTVTLPRGVTTAALFNVQLILRPDRAVLYYDPADGGDPIFLAMCKNHIPSIYTSLLSGHGILNTGVPGSTTTLNVDMVYLNDYNLLAVAPEEKVTPSSYGTSNQALTITLAGLANAAARNSTAVDNTVYLYEDVLFFVKATLAAAAVSATGYINIYGYATVDGGTTYPEAITGTDAAVTLSAPPNLVLLAQITANANNKVCLAGPFSFCKMYGLPRLPARWGLVFVNQSGAALIAGAGNHGITWQGIEPGESC